ncbi:hypothetical protein CHELA1G11_21743 [Hyphomicrobiales bacterium]|nr:hypothetical protein CHELA1G2_20008 [Hyphomicrobiales bacterium]CAH1695010.1 hypothetical protein CHELA1G11_21743 [Hyphomicrobiales bacterium]
MKAETLSPKMMRSVERTGEYSIWQRGKPWDKPVSGAGGLLLPSEAGDRDIFGIRSPLLKEIGRVT